MSSLFLLLLNALYLAMLSSEIFFAGTSGLVIRNTITSGSHVTRFILSFQTQDNSTARPSPPPLCKSDHIVNICLAFSGIYGVYNISTSVSANPSDTLLQCAISETNLGISE